MSRASSSRTPFVSSLAVALLWSVACKNDGDAPCGWASRDPDPSPADRNVLVVVLDDVGANQLPSHREADDDLAPTPTIDCLCDRGVRFERAWAAPMCSPGRATLQTGRLADRTGIGENLDSEGELPDAEVTLAETLAPAGYAAGVVGKWHLAGWKTPDALIAPMVQGFDSFRGTPGNLQGGGQPDPPGDIDYFNFWESIDGDLTWITRYATTATANDALAFVENTEPPWILVVNFHSPHKPLHDPPRDLISEPLTDDAVAVDRYRAMFEATDAELGRLLRSIEPELLAETTVVLTSDNGTSPPGTPGLVDDDRVKSTLYEAGIHVPLVFAGAGIDAPGSSSEALVHLVDLLPTFATWTDATVQAEIDGVDLAALVDDPDLPGPTNVRTRWGPFSDLGFDEAARDDRYKLAIESGVHRLHDLETDPEELVNLLDEEPLSSEIADAYDRLLAALAAPTAEGRWE